MSAFQRALEVEVLSGERQLVVLFAKEIKGAGGEVGEQITK